MQQPFEIALAPMLDYTDRHLRFFLRALNPSMTLFTEMIPAQALIRKGEKLEAARFDPREAPVALQLGTGNPQDLLEAAKIAAALGFKEVNLNLGCPSPSVRQGGFGAVLMKDSARCAALAGALVLGLPRGVTSSVKMRLGADEELDEPRLLSFMDAMHDSGVSRFIVHARMAWLKGLSPKENRDIPPLRYERVHALKRRRPHWNILLNGGIKTPQEALAHQGLTDGVMIGRALLEDYTLAQRLQGGVLNFASAAPEALDYLSRQCHEPREARVAFSRLRGFFRGIPFAKRVHEEMLQEVRSGRFDSALRRAESLFESRSSLLREAV